MIEKYLLHQLIRSALEEDVGSGDVTTFAIVGDDDTGVAEAVAKDDIIVAGLDVFREVFVFVNRDIRYDTDCRDGQHAPRGSRLARVTGSLRSILTAERIALNFFQRMCGIATLTRRYVDAIKGTTAQVLDTRKTIPGFRTLDKYAVRTGGGFNHRMGLYGGAMIKDNHISAAGSISKAVSMVSHYIPPTLKIEVEVKNLDEVNEAVSAGADIIMLDNMDVESMREAVLIIDGRALTEASGNVTLANVREIAETGVNFISVGAITHSAPAADISLNIVKE